ncbi:MAG TPA: hypothetical protein VF256_14995, partial [Streptosporangiaceae bacterium]
PGPCVARTAGSGCRCPAPPSSSRSGSVDGTANAVVFEASPVGQVTIIGPGAGPELAGQGVLSDIIAVASRRAGSS